VIGIGGRAVCPDNKGSFCFLGVPQKFFGASTNLDSFLPTVLSAKSSPVLRAHLCSHSHLLFQSTLFLVTLNRAEGTVSSPCWFQYINE
jgi:hypothetical protein